MSSWDYNLLFRWFIGLSMDDPVWDHSTFSKNRDRLLESDIARGLFDAILAQAEARDLTSDEHFTVMHDHDKFCTNPRCVLHVSAKDANVMGRGEWAILSNRRTFARVSLNVQHFCHACAEDPDNAPQFELFS